MKQIVLYIHGQGGNVEEARHYRSLFKNSDVVGLYYHSQTPWEATVEFPRLFDGICAGYDSVTVIANSIGAYYAMQALADKKIDRAFFISPIVNMQKIIETAMARAGVSENELREKETVITSFGQALSWQYLSFVRKHPVSWHIPTRILYGSEDNLTDFETVSAFARQTGAALTVMEGAEHWFHTEEQMKFLDDWIRSALGEEPDSD